MIRRTFFTSWAVALLIGTVLYAPATSRAQADRKDVYLSGNPHGAFVLYEVSGKWKQWSVSVANSSAKPRTVRPTYISKDTSGTRMEFYRTVVIPPHSIRQATIVSHPGIQEITDRKKKSREEIEWTIELRDAETGRLIKKKSGPATKIGPRQTTVATILNSDFREPRDTSAYLRQMPSSPMGNVQLLGEARHDKLPDRWYAYSIVNVLIVSGIDPVTIRQDQAEAILNWVRRGGTVVLAGTVNMPDMLEGEFGSAAGVMTMGVHRVSSLRVSRPANRTRPGTAVGLKHPMPMVELSPTTARVLYESNGLPLLTFHQFGRGRIFTLAVPVGALKGKSLHSLWSEIHSKRAPLPMIDAGVFASPGKSALDNIAGRRAPSRAVPITILVILAITVLLGGLLLRLPRAKPQRGRPTPPRSHRLAGRGELLWVFLVPASLLLSAGIYFYAISRVEGQRLSYVGLVTNLDGRWARIQQVFAYSAGPSPREMTFSADDPRGIIEDIGQRSSGTLSLRSLETARSLRLPKQRIEINGSRAFYVDTVMKTPGISGDLSFGPDGVLNRLRNDLPVDLTDAVLCINGRTYSVGTLQPERAAGTTITGKNLLGYVEFVDAKRPRSLAMRRKGGHAGTPRGGLGATRPRKIVRGEFTASLVHNATDTLRNRLLRAIAGRPGLNTPVSSQPVLIGYAKYTPIHPIVNGKLNGRGWSVVVWPVRMSAPPVPGPVSIPAGFVTLDYRHQGAPVWDGINHRFNRAVRPGALMVLARAPSVIGGLSGTTATLSIRMRANGYRLTILGGGSQRRSTSGYNVPTVVLRRVLNPSGVKIEVPDADRFLAPDGSYVFTLKIDRAESAGDTSSGAPWQFESIDVALKGHSR